MTEATLKTTVEGWLKNYVGDASAITTEENSSTVENDVNHSYTIVQIDYSVWLNDDTGARTYSVQYLKKRVGDDSQLLLNHGPTQVLYDIFSADAAAEFHKKASMFPAAYKTKLDAFLNTEGWYSDSDAMRLSAVDGWYEYPTGSPVAGQLWLILVGTSKNGKEMKKFHIHINDASAGTWTGTITDMDSDKTISG